MLLLRFSCAVCVCVAMLFMCCFLFQALLDPLERTGVLVKRSTEELRLQLPNFTVIERETKVCRTAGRWPCNRQQQQGLGAAVFAAVVHPTAEAATAACCSVFERT